MPIPQFGQTTASTGQAGIKRRPLLGRRGNKDAKGPLGFKGGGIKTGGLPSLRGLLAMKLGKGGC